MKDEKNRNAAELNAQIAHSRGDSQIAQIQMPRHTNSPESPAQLEREAILTQGGGLSLVMQHPIRLHGSFAKP